MDKITIFGLSIPNELPENVKKMFEINPSTEILPFPTKEVVIFEGFPPCEHHSKARNKMHYCPDCESRCYCKEGQEENLNCIHCEN